MPWYRMGEPGKDSVAHLCRMKNPVASCKCPRFPEDDAQYGDLCGRMSTALCDAPLGARRTCDIPMCEAHRTPSTTKKNTDYCSQHRQLA
jgi:hypothetical protein